MSGVVGRRAGRWVMGFLILLGLGGCGSIRDSDTRPETVFAVTSSNVLIRFNAGKPGAISSYRPITGLQSGERIVGIDFRPANGRLYGVGTAGQLYTIDTGSAIAEPVGPGRFRSLARGDVGFDFNPVADRIRMVTGDGDNLRLDPDSGQVIDVDATSEGLQLDADLAYAQREFWTGQQPRVAAAAFSNSRPGSRQTTIFAIDRVSGALVTQGSHERAFTRIAPETGLLHVVGRLGIALGEGAVSFDVSTANIALLCVTTSGRSALYEVDLRTGRASPLGRMGVDVAVTAMAIAPPGL